MVVRREGTALRTYVHVGSGNYNTATSKLYTDLSFFTADDDIGADTADVFNYLTVMQLPGHSESFLLRP
jgi:polyphosphate kinase